MPSVITDASAPATPPKPSIKPQMAKVVIPGGADVSPSRLNQPLPSPPPASTTLVPPSPARPIRLQNPVSPAKPTRTMSHPIITHQPIQLPPTVPEEHRTASPISPLYRQVSGSSPILERDSANSRYSLRRRASTSASFVRRNSRPFGPEFQDAPLDEEAQKWAEEIHKKRESKRRWREAEDEDRIIIGNKVDANHPNYITAYNMLTGLRVAVFLLWSNLT
jgi:1-phosphatidylinositol-4-phosphate 5-kinase